MSYIYVFQHFWGLCLILNNQNIFKASTMNNDKVGIISSMLTKDARTFFCIFV